MRRHRGHADDTSHDDEPALDLHDLVPVLGRVLPREAELLQRQGGAFGAKKVAIKGGPVLLLSHGLELLEARFEEFREVEIHELVKEDVDRGSGFRDSREFAEEAREVNGGEITRETRGTRREGRKRTGKKGREFHGSERHGKNKEWEKFGKMTKLFDLVLEKDTI